MVQYILGQTGCKVVLLRLPEAPTPDPKSSVSNVTLSPLQKEELAKIRRKQLANAVQYIWETGEDKYMLRYFHTGFWLSCEKHNEGLRAFRGFIPAVTKATADPSAALVTRTV